MWWWHVWCFCTVPLLTSTSPSSTPTRCPGSTTRCFNVKLTWWWDWSKTESAWSLCCRSLFRLSPLTRTALIHPSILNGLFSPPTRFLTSFWVWPAQPHPRNTRVRCGVRCWCPLTASSSPFPTSPEKTLAPWSSSGCILHSPGFPYGCLICLNFPLITISIAAALKRTKHSCCRAHCEAHKAPYQRRNPGWPPNQEPGTKEALPGSPVLPQQLPWLVKPAALSASLMVTYEAFRNVLLDTDQFFQD